MGDPYAERKRAPQLSQGKAQARRDARTPNRSKWTYAALPLVALAAVLLAPAVLAADGAPGAGTTGRSIGRDILIVVALVVVSGVFAMAETAMLTVRRTRIEQLVEEGNRSAASVAQLLAEPTRMLAAIQVGITLVQFLSAGAAAESAVEPLSAFLRREAAAIPWVVRNAGFIAFIVVVGSVSLLSLVVGEITPKGIAIRHAERIALFAAWPIKMLQTIAAPVVWLVNTLSRILVKPFGGSVSFSSSALSEEELKIMVEQSEEHGVIESDEREMIHSIFDFADTQVRKVMTPRLDIATVEADASVHELVRVAVESGHSRLPVFDDTLDNIVGIVHIKDVLGLMTASDEDKKIRDLMRPPYYIPDGKRVDDLLEEFQRTKQQMAVVRDEYGTVTGIVTVEDLLEEIVGEIEDEYDVVQGPPVIQVDEFTSIVDARMPLEDFNERMGVELPSDETDTLGGFVFGLLGHQPQVGEGAVFDGLEFRVEATDGRRIQKLRVVRQPDPSTEDARQETDAHPRD